MSDALAVEMLRLPEVGTTFPKDLIESLKLIVLKECGRRPPEEKRVIVLHEGVSFEFRVRHEGLDNFFLESIGSHTVSSIVISLEMEEGS